MDVTKNKGSEFEALLTAARALLADESDSADALEANDLVCKALAMRPTSAPAWLLKCQALSSLRDDTAALACIEMALRHAPKSAENQYWKAAVLSDLSLHQDAFFAIESAFQLIGSDDFWLFEDLYFEKAMILNALGRLEEAVSTYETGLRRCPNSGLLRNGLAPLRRANIKSRLVILRGGLA